MNATTHIESVDDLLATLADSRRRTVLRYLRDCGDESVTTADIASHLATGVTGTDRRQDTRKSLALDLHHVHLPKLDDAGLVEYDASDRVASYRSDERVEELLGALERFE